MDFISYQKLVNTVKDEYYSKGLSYELALEMGLNWHCLCLNLITCKLLNFHGKN